MKVYIVEKNLLTCDALRCYFNKEDNVEVVNQDFATFMQTHKVDCIVSPANSYGLMDGGYDAAITDWFGNQLQERVQQYIIDNFYGEQPVATSFIIDAGKDNQKLIHTPTMRVPEKIADKKVVYHCTRSTLIAALKNNIDSIVLPTFGGLTGGLDAFTIAKMMYLAYYQITHPIAKINWNTIFEIDEKWKELRAI